MQKVWNELHIDETNCEGRRECRAFRGEAYGESQPCTTKETPWYSIFTERRLTTKRTLTRAGAAGGTYALLFLTGSTALGSLALGSFSPFQRISLEGA